MADVFLSYSSKDRAIAARVQQALERRNLDVFWDQETPPGMDWDTWARGKLAEAKVAIVLWSKNSVASDSVRHEAMLARKANKLLPALIDNLTPEDLPMGLYMVQSVAMSDWADMNSKGMSLLIAETEARLGREGAAARAERLMRSTAIGNRRLPLLPALGGLAVAAIAAAAAFWLGQQGKTSEAAVAPDASLPVSAAPAPITPASSAEIDEALAFAEARTCYELRAYLRDYPDGRFKAQATADIARECAPAPTTTAAPKPKPAAPAAPPPPPVDPCVQARADWASISSTNDAAVLNSFMSATPGACETQRALAMARLDTLKAQSDEAKRAQWLGVPQFDGEWVLDTGAPNAGCGNFPWRHARNGDYIRRIYGNGDFRDMRVAATSPPTIRVRENNRGRAVIEADGRMRIEDKDGNLDCYLKRQ